MGTVYMADIIAAISESTGENAEVFLPDTLYEIDGAENYEGDWYETEI